MKVDFFHAATTDKIDRCLKFGSSSSGRLAYPSILTYFLSSVKIKIVRWVQINGAKLRVISLYNFFQDFPAPVPGFPELFETITVTSYDLG